MTEKKYIDPLHYITHDTRLAHGHRKLRLDRRFWHFASGAWFWNIASDVWFHNIVSDACQMPHRCNISKHYVWPPPDVTFWNHVSGERFQNHASDIFLCDHASDEQYESGYVHRSINLNLRQSGFSTWRHWPSNSSEILSWSTTVPNFRSVGPILYPPAGGTNFDLRPCTAISA